MLKAYVSASTILIIEPVLILDSFQVCQSIFPRRWFGLLLVLCFSRLDNVLTPLLGSAGKTPFKVLFRPSYQRRVFYKISERCNLD